MKREKIVAANWKLHKSPLETKKFVQDFIKLIPQSIQKQIMIFPQTLSLQTLEDCCAENSCDILTGAQNCYIKDEGAFTGEASVKVLKEMTTDAVLVGHSERRQLFKEENEFLAEKIKIVQSYGLLPLYCIGETLEERKNNQTLNVLKEQLTIGLKHFTASEKLVVAYEPVWAIGTGEVATPEQAQDAHAFIRATLKELTGSDDHKILYGGSVKPENAANLCQKPDIDGFLVGGASLDPKSFAEICQITLS